jgi:hypothetical protein
MYIRRDYDVHTESVHTERLTMYKQRVYTTVYIQRHYYVHTESIQSVHLEELLCTYSERLLCTYNSREMDYVHSGEIVAMYIEIRGDRLCTFFNHII